MSEVYTQIQLEVDQSSFDESGLIGLKLDKSKCFDLLVPSITAALFIGFGLPTSLTLFFTKFYNSQKRFLAFNEWISHQPTTACNGLIQGCSLSLLAINLHMSVWVALLKCLPDIRIGAFIDDSYLWVKYEKADSLVQAIRATKSWDKMVGQSLNISKCQCWGTDTASRKAVKELFPDFAFCESVVVLGARIQTTRKKDFKWPKSKTIKITRDLELVKTIPCSRSVHEHLISTKVIPQLSFAPHINSIPKDVLTKFQNQIADILWKGRPSWRAKGLLLGILAKPHRSDPVISRAFTTVLDCFTFLKTAPPLHRHFWTEQFEASVISPNSLIAHTFQACSVLGIELVQPFHISTLNAQPVSILDFAKRDLKAFLVATCRHVAYYNATRSARKDLNASANLLDFPSTCSANSLCSKIPHPKGNLSCFRDSVVTGCVATNDRRAAAGMTESKACRYCGYHDETFTHLVSDCPSLPIVSDRPLCDHEFGPNFVSHGIVEIPNSVVERRLVNSCPSHVPVTAWDSTASQKPTTYWTDGSCDRQSSYWFCCGAYAIINIKGITVASGPVQHWALSSYTCELWAILVAFFGSPGETLCVTDCLSVVNQFQQMIRNGCVDTTWSHQEWWNSIITVYQHPTSFTENPLTLKWCPSHVLENVHEDLITEKMANLHGTTHLDLLRNRQADRAAKNALALSSGLNKHTWELRCKSISTWQIWLAKVAALVGETSICTEESTSRPSRVVANPPSRIVPVESLTRFHEVADFQHYFPKWDWIPPFSFPWKSSFNPEIALHSYASLTNQQWLQGLDFFHNIAWHQNPAKKTAFVELAFYAWDAGWRFQGIPEKVAAYSSF